MLPRLYDEALSVNSYKYNGYGFIRDCKKCEVTEERNGAYTLNMIVAPSDPLFNQIAINKFIKAKPNNEDNPQLFEINKLVILSNGDAEIHAQHIKFLACQNCISNEGNTVGYKLSGTPQAIMTEVFNDLQFTNIFSFYSDITDENALDLSESPSQKVGDILGGDSEKSLVNVFGGEFHYDNFKIELLKSRGSYSGHKIMFGYNMSDFSQTVTNDNCYTHIMGYAKITRSDKDGEYAVLAGNPCVCNTTRVFPKVNLIDFTNDVKELYGGDIKVDTTTGNNVIKIQNAISSLTKKYVNKNGKTSEDVNIVITYNSMLDKIQDIKLCDTADILFGEDKPNITAQVTKVTYDSLAERYTLVEFGEKKLSLIDFLIKKRR